MESLPQDVVFKIMQHFTPRRVAARLKEEREARKEARREAWLKVWKPWREREYQREENRWKKDCRDGKEDYYSDEEISSWSSISSSEEPYMKKSEGDSEDDIFSEFLGFRLVSKGWCRAINECDPLWTRIYGKRIILNTSVHDDFFVHCEGDPCHIAYHYEIPTLGTARTTYREVLLEKALYREEGLSGISDPGDSTDEALDYTRRLIKRHRKE